MRAYVPLRSARRGLLGNARAFFEQHLPGVFPWDAIKQERPESLPQLEGGRRNPLGKYREHVVLTFGRFVLTIASPEDDPPLGWIECRDTDTNEVSEGPPDHVIWQNIAKFIKERING